MTPPKAAGGFGTYRPSSVVVALGDPGVPVICWARAVVAIVNNEHAASSVTECNLAWVRKFIGLLMVATPPKNPRF